ncbi:MAG: replicative DNA helicase [Desulfovibrio sp.]|jgi:replicative DNA helicase|nr:replicative DNA helicase [Desulfovibrio sp.]
MEKKSRSLRTTPPNDAALPFSDDAAYSSAGPGPAAGLVLAAAPERRAPDLIRNIPPHSIEAEQGVLGGVFLQPDSLNVLVDMLHEDDFYLPAHRHIFAAFKYLSQNGVPVDLITTVERLKGAQKLEEAGGAAYLGELAGAIPSAANAEYYSALVRDKAMARLLIDSCADIISASFAPGREVQALLNEAEEKIFAISGRNSSRTYKDAGELTKLVFNTLQERANAVDPITGVHTGYHALDAMTSGFQPSDLIILGARPSVGKTALALNIAMLAAVTHHVPVLIYSLEMSNQQLMARMLCSWAKVDVQRLRMAGKLSDEDLMYLHDAGEIFSQAPLYIDDAAALNTMQMRARTRRLKAEKDIGLVIIDYLQLMQSSRRTDSRELEISDISRNLKAMAKELNIPVLALAQLSREADKRATGEKGDKLPRLSDLRESGAIEQDADVVMFIHRDTMSSAKYEDRPAVDKATIVIAKHRNGPTGKFDLLYTPAYTAFVEEERFHSAQGQR